MTERQPERQERQTVGSGQILCIHSFGERERERLRHRDTERQTDTDRHRQTDRQTGETDSREWADPMYP